MYRYSFTFTLLFIYCGVTIAQQCHLNAQYEVKTSRAILDWNMVDYSGKTTYILLRSTNEQTWTEVVTDKMFRKYSKEDIFDYDDKVTRNGKYFYRLKIVDANNKTIALSNIVSVSGNAIKSVWTIYPNPVNGVLNLVCQGNDIITGVINVAVQDMTGKIVTRFRAASTNRRLEIPVSQLRKGIYVVQVIIMNELVMKEKFVKQ